MTADTMRERFLLRGGPELLFGVACAMLTGLTFGNQKTVSPAATVVVLAAAWALVYFVLRGLFQNANVKNWVRNCIYVLVGTALCGMAAVIQQTPAKEKAMVFGMLCAFVLLVMGLLLKLTGQWNDATGVMLLLAAGFALRVLYVLYTGHTTRQHDVWSFGEGGGHCGYIEFLYENMKLPDFDVRTVDQFYHPPLHHFLAACWMRLLTALGATFAEACESVQMLTLFYSSLCMVITYRILHELGLSGRALLIALAIVVFHPSFILFAGSINNDILSITFILASVLFAIRWYKLQKDPLAAEKRGESMKTILKLAVCIGCGMMTKVSAYMVAPAVAVLFLLVLWQKLEDWKEYFRQFAAFGALCFPLGLWWGVRNLIGYGVPITYVPRLSNNSKQYVGYHPFWERLFDFGNGQLAVVYDQYEFYGGAYFEYNPTIGVLKTAMFGELLCADDYPQITQMGPVLFWIGTALAVLAVLIMAVCLLKRDVPGDSNLRWFFGVLYLTFFVLYYFFCFTYPHTCTMNVRYVAPLIVVGAAFIGLFLQDNEARKTAWAKWMNALCTILVIAFCASSATVYLLVAG